MENTTIGQSDNDTSSLKYHGPLARFAGQDILTLVNAVLQAEEERDRLKQRIAVLLEALQDFEDYLDASAAVYSSDYDLLGKVQLAILKASGGK